MKFPFVFLILFPVMSAGQIVPPYFNDFESGSAGWYDSTLSGSSWELGTPAFGITTGAHSGSNAWDVDLDSAYLNNTSCFLYSPMFDFSNAGNSVISFWHNYKTEGLWDEMKINYSIDSGLTWKWLFDSGFPSINLYDFHPFSGQTFHGESNCWINTVFSADSLSGHQYVQLRFHFTADNTIIADGYSIDDFSIFIPQLNDAAVVSVENPQVYSQQANPHSVLVKIGNIGSAGIMDMDVSYSINGGSPAVLQWNGQLTSISADTISLPVFNAPPGWSEICVYTSLTGDSNNSNDTLCCSFYYDPVYIAEVDEHPFEVFPNPANGSLYIRNMKGNQLQKIIIRNLHGHIVHSITSSGKLNAELDINFKPGYYIVEIIDGDVMSMIKIIVTGE